MRAHEICEMFSGRVCGRQGFLLSQFKPGNILDIGNIGGLEGVGPSNSFYLSLSEKLKQASTLYGFDLFPPPDRCAALYPRQKGGNIENGLPYEDSFFDTVYMGQVIEHLRNPGYALKEISRVLKADGVLIVDTPNAYHWKKLLAFVFLKKESLGDPTHQFLFTPASLISFLEKGGFRIGELAEKDSSWTRLLPSIARKGLGTSLLVSAMKATSSAISR